MTERNLYGELRELQQARCGICGGDTSLLVEDHDHESGFVRGLLCVSCNTSEGRHAPCGQLEWGMCHICLWRKRPAVAWLGWTEQYSSPLGDIPEHLEFAWRPSLASAHIAVDWANSQAVRRADIIARLYTDEVAS